MKKRRLVIENLKQATLPNIWKYLSYPTLLAFCCTAKRYYKILKKKKTWKYLLQRDFNFIKDNQSNYQYFSNLSIYNPKEYYELRYLLEINNPDWFNEINGKNLDTIIMSRMEQAAYKEPEEKQVYWVFNNNDLIATISGYNRYHVTVKTIIHIDYENYKETNRDSLKYYLRVICGDRILKGKILSFLDMFNYCYRNNIKPIRDIPHY